MVLDDRAGFNSVSIGRALPLEIRFRYREVMQNTKTLHRILLVSCALGFFACSSREVIMPENELTPYATASERTPVATSLRMTIDSVKDLRPGDDHVVGSTGVYQQIPVSFERSVTETVSDQLAKELKARGLEQGPSGDLVAEVTIKKLDLKAVSNGPFMAPACNFEMGLKINRPAKGRHGEFTISSNFTAPTPIVKTRLAHAQTFASCMNLAVERLVKTSEFTRLLE